MNAKFIKKSSLILIFLSSLLLIMNTDVFGSEVYDIPNDLDLPAHITIKEQEATHPNGIITIQKESQLPLIEGEFDFPPQEGFPYYFNDGSTIGSYGSLTLADINNDGIDEIIATNVANFVYVLDGYGEVLSGWPVHLPSQFMNWHSSTVSDLDYDRQMEIIAVNEEGLFILNAKGKILAAVENPPNFYLQTPTIGNVDNAGNKEIIVLARGYNEALLYILSYKSILGYQMIMPYKGFPIVLEEADIPDINTSPAVADFDFDHDLEIVFINFDYMHGQPAYLYLLHHDDPQMISKGWKTEIAEYNMRALAIGNTDIDKELEIAVAGEIYNSDGSYAGRIFDGSVFSSDVTIGDIDHDGIGEIIAHRHNELYVGKYNPWTQSYEVLWTVTDHQGWQSSPSSLMADIDSDGDIEIITYGSDNYINAFEADGSPVFGFPFKVTDINYIEWASPAIGDIDGDGDVELILSPLSRPPAIYAWDLLTDNDQPEKQWVMFEYDSEHTAKWKQP